MPIESFVPVPDSDPPNPIRMGFASSLKRMRIDLLICAMAGFGVSVLVVAIRWWFLLRIQEIHIRAWEAVRLTFLGLFFNTVVPGTVGGDLVKAWYVAKHTPKKAAVLVSIFVDRLLGLTEMTLLATVMVAIVYFGKIEPYERIRMPLMAVLVVLAVLIVTLAFLLSRRFRRLFHLQKLYQRLPIAHHIAAAGDAAVVYRRQIGQLFKAILMTIGAHVFFIGAITLLGLSLRLDTPWYNFFIYIPLIYIIGAIPISPGGAGWIENLYVWFFAPVSASMVLALALLARLIPILWGIPGIIVAVKGPRLPKTEALEAELGIEAPADSDPCPPRQDS